MSAPDAPVLVTWVLLIPYLLLQLGYSKEHHPGAGLVLPTEGCELALGAP